MTWEDCTSEEEQIQGEFPSRAVRERPLPDVDILDVDIPDVDPPGARHNICTDQGCGLPSADGFDAHR
jgi:hypothetical protein